MAITQSMVQAQPVMNVATGRYLDDAGSPAAPTITIGFVPRFVEWFNVTDRISYQWFDGMAAASALKQVAAGTRTLELSEGITVNAAQPAAGVSQPATPYGSFTVAAAAVLQNKQYSWRAYA